MNGFKNRLWNKKVKTKHEHFRTWRSLRNIKPNHVIKTRLGVLIKVTGLDNQI